MFKFTCVLGLARSTTNQPNTDLTSLTVEQAMAVSAGNSEPTTKEKPTDKPPVATTTSSDSPPTIPGNVGLRPPFN